ncbi:MAG: YggS family pyridoxal phosphate-dependent enzyme [Alphaproteobacteria bacterium]|nr:YggS family pyridoxal phosphate-dependent enzyme [Alphaproteobacteria bacterium]
MESPEESSIEASIESPEGALARVRADLAAQLKQLNRPASAVTLIGVSKMVPVERIKLALAAGLRVFGENRIEEANAKWPPLKTAYNNIELHFIGTLQSKKAAQAVALFDAIHSLDRPRLARALAHEMHAQNRYPQLFIQVNTGSEPQKSGVLPKDAKAFIHACRTDYGLTIDGLMCLPPVAEPPAPHFALLQKIAQNNDIRLLSMGMSRDYATALRFGATHIRLGTAIFGPRQPTKPQ